MSSPYAITIIVKKISFKNCLWCFPGRASSKKKKQQQKTPANAGDIKDVGLIPGSMP